MFYTIFSPVLSQAVSGEIDKSIQLESSQFNLYICFFFPFVDDSCCSLSVNSAVTLSTACTFALLWHESLLLQPAVRILSLQEHLKSRIVCATFIFWFLLLFCFQLDLSNCLGSAQLRSPQAALSGPALHAFPMEKARLGMAKLYWFWC